MNADKHSELVTLTKDEINCVGGSGGTPGELLRAQDMWGGTVSMEEYMDRQLMALKTGDSRWVFGDPLTSGPSMPSL